MTDFNSKQYKRVIAACKERDKFPTQAWIPDKEKCVHSKLHDAQDELINFEEQSLSIDVSLHIGSFIAVSSYFYKDISNLLVNKFLFFKIIVS